eukprot:CAMPEP_0115307854 /NCGR_PEP_ID=MMETSP0270-20121206/73367_1 /TAXON_ID=71861 /ORGANISM="Scrippsiella trochoidea, Strain CCMP3099" /LENGTH=105 /DNA_ID=CAMNT_0002726333 /DNA_START=204 /DNA_END=518 /DNA_ORIENTATION=+
MALLQRELAYKTREARLGHPQQTASTPKALTLAGSSFMTKSLRACDADLEVLQDLGLVDPVRQCLPHNPLGLMSIVDGPYVTVQPELNNHAAQIMIMAWSVIVVL